MNSTTTQNLSPTPPPPEPLAYTDPPLSRKAWATARRTPDPAEAMKNRSSVTTRALAYGTRTEIAAARVELDSYYAASDKPLRAANAIAKAVMPMHGQRLKTQDDVNCYTAALAGLAPALRDVVNEAVRLRDERRTVTEWSAALGKGRLGDGREAPAILLDGQRFPALSALCRRLTGARDEALAAYLRDVEARPVGDVEWHADRREA